MAKIIGSHKKYGIVLTIKESKYLEKHKSFKKWLYLSILCNLTLIGYILTTIY